MLGDLGRLRGTHDIFAGESDLHCAVAQAYVQDRAPGFIEFRLRVGPQLRPFHFLPRRLRNAVLDQFQTIEIFAALLRAHRWLEIAARIEDQRMTLRIESAAAREVRGSEAPYDRRVPQQQWRHILLRLERGLHHATHGLAALHRTRDLWNHETRRLYLRMVLREAHQ